MKDGAATFADPEVQNVFEFLQSTPIGDYQNGVWAYGMGLAKDPHPFIDGTIPRTPRELESYYNRVKVWETGYSEASQDSRYQVLARLANFFRGASVS